MLTPRNSRPPQLEISHAQRISETMATNTPPFGANPAMCSPLLRLSTRRLKAVMKYMISLIRAVNVRADIKECESVRTNVTADEKKIAM